MDISRGLSCSLCPNTALDLLGHHAVTCKKGGDVVTRHNRLQDVFVDFCHQAHLGVHVEVGSNLTLDGSRSPPADILVCDWSTGKFAAFDFTVSSPLSVASLNQALIYCESNNGPDSRILIYFICRYIHDYRFAFLYLMYLYLCINNKKLNEILLFTRKKKTFLQPFH